MNDGKSIVRDVIKMTGGDYRMISGAIVALLLKKSKLKDPLIKSDDWGPSNEIILLLRYMGEKLDLEDTMLSRRIGLLITLTHDLFDKEEFLNNTLTFSDGLWLTMFQRMCDEMAIEEDPKDQETKALLVKNLKDFFIVHGTDCLAHRMLDNGVQPGWSSRLYYPFTKDLLVVPDDNQTAKNLLSFFFFAIDTFNDPLKVYHVVSDHLLTGTERITRIEVKIVDMINAVRQYQKAQNDARQVSVVQHQV